MNIQRPHPVINKAAVSGLVTSVAGVLTFLGYVGPAAKLDGMADSIGAVAVGLVLLLSHTVPAVLASKEVTPLENPQAADGTPLRKVTDLQPQVVNQTITSTSGGGGGGWYSPIVGAPTGVESIFDTARTASFNVPEEDAAEADDYSHPDADPIPV